jgi:hypothetical protein
MTDTPRREPGPYWIKFCPTDEWEIAEWQGDYWMICESPFNDRHFAEIDERRITREPAPDAGLVAEMRAVLEMVAYRETIDGFTSGHSFWCQICARRAATPNAVVHAPTCILARSLASSETTRLTAAVVEAATVDFQRVSLTSHEDYSAVHIAVAKLNMHLTALRATETEAGR